MPPLEPFVAQTRRKRASRKKKTQEEDEAVQSDDFAPAGTAALAAPPSRIDEVGPSGQSWPPLAKDVLSNMARFGSCILLTRVGGFYESYFEQAPLLSSLLGIKLANRTWGGRSVAMAGFPLSQLEKYLKVLVHDHGKLVAICEEFRPDEEGGETRSPEDWKTINLVNRATLNEKVDIVRRVTRVVSPGTLIDEKWVNPMRNNFILSIAVGEGEQRGGARGGAPTIGLAWLDLSTSDLHITHCSDVESLRDEVKRVSPSEIILEADAVERMRLPSSSALQSGQDVLLQALDLQRTLISYLPPSSSSRKPTTPSAIERQATHTYLAAERTAIANLTEHLSTRLLDVASHGGQELDELIGSGLARHHAPEETMLIDANTLDALEVRETTREGGVRGSLVSTVRRTLTKGGARLLVDWLTAPSTSHALVTERHAIVEYLVTHPYALEDLRTLLRQVQRGDISRTLQRIATARNDEQDLLEVRDFVRFTSAVKEWGRELRGEGKEGHRELAARLEGLVDLTGLGKELGDAIDERVMEKRLRAMEALDREEGLLGAENADEEAETTPSPTPSSLSAFPPPPTPRGDEPWGAPFEHLIRPSSSRLLSALTAEYERLRHEASSLQSSLRYRIGPRTSLRYLLGQGFVVHTTVPTSGEEPSNDQELRLTLAYRTKSTRTYYHEPWSRIGSRLAKLQEDLKRAENAELRRLRARVVAAGADLRGNARKVDEVDCLAGWAQLALDLRLVRPTMLSEADEHYDGSGCVFDVVGGRHIGVEGGLLERGRTFHANDLKMDATSRLHFITGPNMGGKSTYLRQNALIAILAQSGSFVPAQSARLSIVDRLFSRVGAKDDLFRDRSTFMVEMLETAEILRRATRRSLVVADEIGRGTTTQVGIAIAFATLKEMGEIGCRALFASHLHELADMMGWEEGRETGGEGWRYVRFASTDVEGSEDSVTYLHHVRPGVNRESHGLTVAALAGMPPGALQTARDTLNRLRAEDIGSQKVVT
ncbi:hypothetical protein BDZ90DRAFT_255441 [Jaminaea rosea]|uniref:DNA mismatch repair proteins mutS family domain-containing protein n=1 Tax=Jaminaea rosea TaxID=1569628 RepID=A0A316UK68_9BASI|nr:hypothetical protein BDZ90DRAFT_255441 [Jaminaea rosea]PWN25647.1 hypothetical protein BDZ90DRAFT_255441 [Jaminaea rosea]